MRDIEEEIMIIAEELADSRYNMDFYNLSEELQQQIFQEAELTHSENEVERAEELTALQEDIMLEEGRERDYENKEKESNNGNYVKIRQ